MVPARSASVRDVDVSQFLSKGTRTFAPKCALLPTSASSLFGVKADVLIGLFRNFLLTSFRPCHQSGMIHSQSNLACLSQYSMKSRLRSSLKESSCPSSTEKLFKSTCQEARGEKQVREWCISSDFDREESPSFHSMLETTFSSMSSIQLSRHGASTQDDASACHQTPSDQLSHQAHQDQDVTSLRYLLYIIIVSFLDCLLEGLILILQRHIHRVPILLRLKFVKTLVKASTGDFPSYEYLVSYPKHSSKCSYKRGCGRDIVTGENCQNNFVSRIKQRRVGALCRFSRVGRYYSGGESREEGEGTDFRLTSLPSNVHTVDAGAFGFRKTFLLS